MAAQTMLRDRDIAPVEVRVYRYGLLKVCEWCDSEHDATALVEIWTATDGTRCEIHRLTS